MKRVYQCFPGGKHKALTLSYDDGRSQDRRLVSLFNQYGLRGTFHLNSGLMDEGHVQPEEIPSLYQGHVAWRAIKPLPRMWVDRLPRVQAHGEAG